MSALRSEAQERIADAAIGKVDDLSSKLYHLTQMVKLAAFAAESRRMLNGIDNAKSSWSEMEKVIEDAVPASNSWLEMEDAAGNVLAYVARQLDEVNGDFTRNVYDLVNAASHEAGT